MGPHNHMKHQQRQRGRGRKPGGGGHGGGHPGNRNFESNGPDVKVRGSASTIYEKYLQLARDANSSGDRVMAESYLQHAEHYYRVLRATQPAHQPVPVEHRYERFGHDPDLDDEETVEDGDAVAEASAREGGEQPDAEGREARPHQGYREERGPRHDGPRGEGEEEFRRGRRNRRNRFRPDGERGPRPETEGGEGYEAREPREPREDREPREERAPRAEGDDRPPRRERGPRREQGEAPEGFADSPKPAFLAGD